MKFFCHFIKNGNQKPGSKVQKHRLTFFSFIFPFLEYDQDQKQQCKAVKKNVSPVLLASEKAEVHGLLWDSGTILWTLEI